MDTANTTSLPRIEMLEPQGPVNRSFVRMLELENDRELDIAETISALSVAPAVRTLIQKVAKITPVVLDKEFADNDGRRSFDLVTLMAYAYAAGRESNRQFQD